MREILCCGIVIVKCDDICFAHILAEIECDGCEILVRSE